MTHAVYALVDRSEAAPSDLIEPRVPPYGQLPVRALPRPPGRLLLSCHGWRYRHTPLELSPTANHFPSQLAQQQ